MRPRQLPLIASHIAGTDAAQLRALWPDCPARDLCALRRFASPLTLRPGQLLVSEGRPAYEMLLLTDGEAIVAHELDLVATVRAGAPIGEMALLGHTTRNATVFMRTYGSALVLTRSELHQLTWTSRYFAGLVDAFAECRARERASSSFP